MAIWKKKNSGYVDLSERMKVREEKVREMREEYSEPVSEVQAEPVQESAPGFFGGFFGGSSGSNPTSTETSSSDSEDRRKKLGKRLMDMTSKIEELENTIYQMNRRMELIERKQRLDY